MIADLTVSHLQTTFRFYFVTAGGSSERLLLTSPVYHRSKRIRDSMGTKSSMETRGSMETRCSAGTREVMESVALIFTLGFTQICFKENCLYAVCGLTSEICPLTIVWVLLPL